MLLAQLQQRVHHAPAHEAEIPHIRRHRNVADILHQAIEGTGRLALHPGVRMARSALAIDHVVAILPRRHHARNHLGRILKVGVDHDHSGADCMVKSRGGGDLLAKIARQIDHGCVRIGCMQPFKDDQRLVGTAVIDIDDLPGIRQSVHHPAQPCMEFENTLRLVMSRHNNGQ